MENNNLIAKRIKQLRSELSLSQEELALKVGLSNKSSIATYESGRSSPPDEIKLKMCELFNCSMDYLMGLSDERNVQDKDKKFIAFYNGYKDMDSADQKMLDDIFNSIVERNKNKNNKN